MQYIRTYALVVLCKWYVITALAIIVLATVVRFHADVMPEAIVIPKPSMPSPNARDYYSAAEAMERDGKLVDFACDGPTKPTPGVAATVAADPTSGFHVFTLSEKDKLVAENLPAIAKLHDGMRYPYMQPPVRSFDMMTPYLAKDRAMARLLSLEGQMEAAHGNWAGAMNAYLDCMRIGSDLPHGSELIGMLVGVACDAIGRKHAGAAIVHLSSSQARADVHRLEAIEANEVAGYQTLQQEEWATQASLLKLFDSPRWRSWTVDNFWGDGEGGSGLGLEIALHAMSPRTAFDNYTNYMNETIAQAKLPWPAQRSASPPPMPTDPMNRVLLPIFSQATYKLYATLALDRLLETQIALHAYRLDHHKYPSALAQLVPNYLSAVPSDPFTAGLPLKYRISRTFYTVYKSAAGADELTTATEARVTGTHYLLYSVGPDAIDDQGTPSDYSKYPTYALSGLASPDERGDIVAGVNY